MKQTDVGRSKIVKKQIFQKYCYDLGLKSVQNKAFSQLWNPIPLLDLLKRLRACFHLCSISHSWKILIEWEKISYCLYQGNKLEFIPSNTFSIFVSRLSIIWILKPATATKFPLLWHTSIEYIGSNTKRLNLHFIVKN